MSDGRIQIDIDIDGKPVKSVTRDIKELEQTSSNSSKGVESVGDALKGVDGKPVGKAKEDMQGFGNETQKSGKSLKDFVVALGAVKIASAVFNAMKDSLDGAIARFDTFEKFPKVMEALGFGAEESEHAINKLSGSIDGLPTTLDEIVSSTQKFVGINGSLSRSTDIAEGLNNAFLASGSSSADAARGAEQYAQMLQNGTVDMQSWRSINETMGTSLNYVAKEMLGTSATSMDLYNSIKGGEVAFRDFENQLIKAGTGTGELAKLARENSKGIATSFGNLKNATVKGLANIIASIDKVVKKTTGKNIAENLDSLKIVVNAFFKGVGTGIEMTVPLIELLAKGFKMVYESGQTLSPVLIGIATAFAAYKIITSVLSWMEGYNQATEIASKITDALVFSTKAKTLATMADTGATQAQTLANAANNGTITIGTALVGLLTGKIKGAVIAKAAWTTATGALSGALTFLATNPIGMTITAIGVLVGAGVALYKWFGRQSEASKEMAARTEESKEKVDDLTESVRDSTNARREESSYVQRQISDYKANAEAISELANQEKLSTKEKREMKDMIDELNQQFGDLNLTYDENTGKLNTNNEALQSRLDMYAAHDRALQAERDLKSVNEESLEIEKQLLDVREQQEHVWDDATVTRREIKKTLEELEAQEAQLIAAQQTNSEEYKRLQEEKNIAYEAYATAEEIAMQNQMLTYEMLSESQQQAVQNMQATWQSYADAARDMFNTLSDEQTMTVQEMQANLEENQRVIGEWGTNIAELSRRGVDEGLLNTLREAGPSSAGYVAALVAASDTELTGLSTAFKNGGDTATQALKDAFNLGSQEIPAEIMGMVTSAKTSLDAEIQAANFQGIGKNIPQGLADGVKSGTADAESASKDMAKKTADSTKNELGIHSPSRVFREFGINIADGLAQGIKTSSPKVVSALSELNQRAKRSGEETVQVMKTVANRIPSAFDGLQSKMSSIGANIVSGLAQGINGNAGAALGAAQNLASRIESTLKNAMRIKSPSRLMRDEVGRYIPQGVALGIEMDTPKALTAMQKLSGGLMSKISPEQALGVGRMNYATTAGQVINNSSNSPVHIDNRGLLEGAVFHVREEADIEKVASELDKRTTQKASNKGYRRGMFA